MLNNTGERRMKTKPTSKLIGGKDTEGNEESDGSDKRRLEHNLNPDTTNRLEMIHRHN